MPGFNSSLLWQFLPGVFYRHCADKFANFGTPINIGHLFQDNFGNFEPGGPIQDTHQFGNTHQFRAPISAKFQQLQQQLRDSHQNLPSKLMRFGHFRDNDQCDRSPGIE
jgi:hypothetical protein